jgi:hypothetical protein
MKTIAAAVVALSLAVGMSKASAQTVDVAKISCQQFLTGHVIRRDYLALWLSGYYNGTRNDPIVESNTVQKIADKVSTYCRDNLDATLTDAIQNTFGVDK